MLLRITRKGKPVEVSPDDLIEMTKKGEVTPASLVMSKFMTNGKWVTLDNIEIYHRHSPTPCPPGPLLIKEREEKAKQEADLAHRRAMIKKYESGELIEECLKLTTLTEIIAETNVQAAARLIVEPAFEPETAVTLILFRSCVRVDVVRGETLIWHSLLQENACGEGNRSNREIESIPFDPSKVKRISARIENPDVPPPFNSVGDLIETAGRAQDCTSLALDGCGYLHCVSAGTTAFVASWRNPTREDHPEQIELVSAYEDIVRRARFPEEKPRFPWSTKKNPWWQF